MYLMNIPQEEENELDALQSAKELEEEKKKEKERQAKMESIVLLNLYFGFLGYTKKFETTLNYFRMILLWSFA